MTKFKVGGTIISALSLILAGLFIWGLVVGGDARFWAIAGPVIIGFLAALGIAFSIGRLMATTEVQKSNEAQSGEQKDEGNPTSS